MAALAVLQCEEGDVADTSRFGAPLAHSNRSPTLTPVLTLSPMSVTATTSFQYMHRLCWWVVQGSGSGLSFPGARQASSR